MCGHEFYENALTYLFVMFKVRSTDVRCLRKRISIQNQRISIKNQHLSTELSMAIRRLPNV
jgi:hypothetical protein